MAASDGGRHIEDPDLAKVLSGLTSATHTDGAGNTQTVTGGSPPPLQMVPVDTTTITSGGKDNHLMVVEYNNRCSTRRTAKQMAVSQHSVS
ncbi:MAG: hypothetical protein ACLTJ8_07625 [Veillonella atypica]